MQDIERQLAREYEQRRQDAEQQRDERLRDATARDPEIAALLSRQRNRFATASRDMMQRKDDPARIAAALEADILRKQEQIRARLSALGLPPDHLVIQYACTQCNDTGYTDEFSSAPCACRKLRRVQLMREESGIANAVDQTFESFDRAAFSSDEQYQRTMAAKNLCEKYADGLSGGGKLNLILMGESGLGKTFLLNSIADRAIRRGIPALVMTAFHMLGAMREYHFGATGEGNLLDQMTGCELLLIDDLGSEPMLRNITVEYLFMLLNERMTRRLHTVIATNLSPEGLQTRYSERVLSRMMDLRAGELIRLTGSDLRYTRR